MTPSDLARVFRAAAAECEAIAAEATATRAEWIDQHASALGPRRHCRAVQRRITGGIPGAARVGRRQLLSHSAHAEELARAVDRPRPTAVPSVADELRAELRLIGRGR